jgi:hypothetical protein
VDFAAGRLLTVVLTGGDPPVTVTKLRARAARPLLWTVLLTGRRRRAILGLLVNSSSQGPHMTNKTAGAVLRAERPVSSAPAPAEPAAGHADIRADIRVDGQPWWARIPGRVARYVWLLGAPLRFFVWAMDGIVATAMVGVLAVAWAWWTHRITDDQVAAVLSQLGARGLAILTKSGIL